MTGEPLDAAEVTVLFEELAPSLLAYFARRVDDRADAADLVGETLLVLWRRAEDLPEGAEGARMWAFGVARRVLSTYRRGGHRRSHLTARLRHELAAASSETHADPRTARLQDALHRLPPLDQEVVRLVHWDGFTLAEVATLLGRRPGTVRSRYHRARGRLRAELEAPGRRPSAEPDPTPAGCRRTSS